MKELHVRRGARRITALGATTAMAASALAIGLASPAMAAPVPVTTTVTDAAGNGIDGAVTVYQDNGSGTYYYETSQTISGGLVRLALEPGNYKFEFDAAGYIGEFYTDKPSIEAADPVTIGGPTPLAAVSLAPAAGIIGAVTDDQGRPLPYADITLRDLDGATRPISAVSARNGSFAVGAQPGNYELYVSGQSVGNKYYVSEYYNNQPTADTATPIAHGAGTTDVGAISLSRGAMIRGRVTGVADAPLERVRVTASETDCTSNCQSYTDFTDAQGNYVLEGITPKSYRVFFSDPAGEYKSEYNVDATEWGAATPVALAKDQLVDVNASLVAVDPVDPATVDLAGRVVDSAGVPVIGATVTALSTPTDRKNTAVVDRTSTNRQGYYAFTDLDPASSRNSEDTFTLRVEDLYDREEGQFSRLPRYYGGTTRDQSATPVTVPAGGQAAGIDVTLPLTGGFSGKITSDAGEVVHHASVGVLDVDGDQDYGVASADYDGNYETRQLVEGEYKVVFTDDGFLLPSAEFLAHVPEWFSDAITPDDAKTVVVKSGQVTPGINAELTTTLKAVEKPVIAGKQYVGKTLKARPGVWNLNAGTTFRYEWLIGDAVVGSGESITVAKGWTGDKLTLRVTAENGSHTGVALVNSQELGVQPKIKIKTGSAAVISVKAKGVKAKKIKGNVVVREIAKVKPNGKIKYKKIGKAKLKKGKARVSLAKVKGKGKHKLVFTFKFKGKVGDAEITKKIKRKR